MSCFILGDSIAVGVGQARPECRTEATVGITSDRFLQAMASPLGSEAVVISLGVNDGPDVTTEANLQRLRRNLTAARVVWLIPGANPKARQAVRDVAAAWRDDVVDVAPLVGPDGIHPTRAGYALLADQTRGSGHGPGAAVYGDFPARTAAYRDFIGPNIWRGPCNLNGKPVAGPICPPGPALNR